MNDTLRALFPVTERAVYLNHAAVSPPPLPTINAIHSQLADVSENGSVNFRNWIAVKENARRLIAELLGALPEQVAFMRNTSDGLSTVANGLDWRAGDNLVTFRAEFPSNIYPWLRVRDAFGVEVRMCEERDGRIDLDELIALVDDNTRVVAISQVQFASGFRSDLERIGRSARALLVRAARVKSLRSSAFVRWTGLLPWICTHTLRETILLLRPVVIGSEFHPISTTRRKRWMSCWMLCPGRADNSYVLFSRSWQSTSQEETGFQPGRAIIIRCGGPDVLKMYGREGN